MKKLYYRVLTFELWLFLIVLRCWGDNQCGHHLCSRLISFIRPQWYPHPSRPCGELWAQVEQLTAPFERYSKTEASVASFSAFLGHVIRWPMRAVLSFDLKFNIHHSNPMVFFCTVQWLESIQILRVNPTPMKPLVRCGWQRVMRTGSWWLNKVLTWPAKFHFGPDSARQAIGKAHSDQSATRVDPQYLYDCPNCIL